MKNILKYIYIVIFMLISLAPMGFFVVSLGSNNQTANQNIEKTETKEFPKLFEENHINTSFDDECEVWLNQNIPYRGQLIANINLGLSSVLKEPTANVVTGADGWIFSTETLDDYMDTNAFSEEELKKIGITLALIQERIENAGGHFLFVPVPNKNSIYGEYMPHRYPKAGGNNLDRLYEELSKQDISYVNLKQLLLDAKNSSGAGRLYYKRDTHWNALGAVEGYEKMMEELGRSPISYDTQNYSTEYSKQGDLDKLLYPTQPPMDEEIIFDNQLDYEGFEFIHPAGVSDTKAQLDSFMSDREEHDNNFTTKQRKSQDNASLYMIRDSFARALLPYMINSYNEATFVRTVTPSIENSISCEDVIYEICERNLKNLILSAPYMYAPLRDDFNDVMYVCDSDRNTCVCEDEGYAYRIYGTVDSSMLDEDGRVYVRLYGDDSQILVFEAFPIYEEVLLNGNKNTYEKDAYGYSLYIDKNTIDSGNYSVKVASDNYESKTLAIITFGKGNEDELVDEKVDEEGEFDEESGFDEVIETTRNPYMAENAGHQLLYRGCTIGIGDNINALKPRLGDQAAPSEIVTSCLSGTDAVMYYYPNITLETDMEGNIYYISLMDNSYAEEGVAATCESGIALGSDMADIWEKLGKPERENDKNCKYRTEHLDITYSYKGGKVTSVILEDNKYGNDEEEAAEEAKEEELKEKSGVEYDGGNTYMYDQGHHIQTGWKIIDGQYYFFDRLTGERIVGQTVDGIAIGEDGEVHLTALDMKKIETMMKANNVVMEVTLPSDTMEEKRLKVFNWILSFPYHRYRHLKDVYTEEGIEIIEANDIFDEGAGDCVSESAALAFLFHEIGYNNVYWVHDTGHSWVRSDDRLFDPLFAESRDFNANYDAEFTDYRATMAHSLLIY